MLNYFPKTLSHNLNLFHNSLIKPGSGSYRMVKMISSSTEDINKSQNVRDKKYVVVTDSELKNLPLKYPEEPTTCCMSGCANCVWLDYAEKLSGYFKDGGDKAIKEINEKVTDANIKSFLLHELRMKKK